MANYLLPIISGLFAFLGGLLGKRDIKIMSLRGSLFAGKEAFSEDLPLLLKDHFHIEQNSNIIIAARAALFVGVILCNGMMIRYFVISLRVNGATINTIVNFVFNYFLSACAGVLFFGEKLATKWFIGAFFIISGCYLVLRSKSKAEQLAEKKDQ
eukprot:TRINITY_DN1135_c0_g1_i1.p1 TRINITY_DN1135_c0_g1~~TRINITY_DN1135_c0_g1_i1.p1  ORF type:complete len:155 (-),score=16.85 TRINITY_DN1135_c0_g1_i1:301-765(-)